MEESTRWRSHLGERGWYARKIPIPVYRFRYFFSPLFFFLWSFEDKLRKLVSIVTTCLVVLRSRFYFLKNWLRLRNPRRTVMGMTDHRGFLVSKHLEILKNGYWNRLSEIRNGMAGRTVVGTTDRHRLFKEIEFLNFVTEAAERTVAGTTGRHRLRNPRLGRISV